MNEQDVKEICQELNCDTDEALVFLGSLQYNIASKRFRAMRERFWNQLEKYLEIEDESERIEKSLILIEAFAIARKNVNPRKDKGKYRRG